MGAFKRFLIFIAIILVFIIVRNLEIILKWILIVAITFIALYIIYLILRNLTANKAYYVDGKGYYRYYSSRKLVHRNIAFKEIYKCNRRKYPLRFSEYVVHHRDGNKLNNNVSNLQILTKDYHGNIHKRRWGKWQEN
jgi:hypothetical protein